MKAGTQKLHDLGQSLWLDNITRDLLDRRHARALHRRALRHGAHLQPHDLREGDQEQHGLRRRDPERSTRAGSPARSCSSSSRWRTSPGRPTSSGRSTSARTASTAGCRWRCRRCWPTTRRARWPRPGGCTRSRRARTCSSRSPAPGGRARDRGGDLRRRPDQRDAALLARALPGGRRGVHARHRAPHRGGACSPTSPPSRPCSSAAGTRPSRARCPTALRNRLGIAIAKRTYKAYRGLLSSPRWQRIYNLGGRPQRLLWASTGTKDPQASDVLYIRSLAAPFTVNTMPEATLKALAAQERESAPMLPADGGDCEQVLAGSPGRSRRRRARRATPGGGRRLVREVVERADGRAGGEERRSRPEDSIVRRGVRTYPPWSSRSFTDGFVRGEPLHRVRPCAGGGADPQDLAHDPPLRWQLPGRGRDGRRPPRFGAARVLGMSRTGQPAIGGAHAARHRDQEGQPAATRSSGRHPRLPRSSTRPIWIVLATEGRDGTPGLTCRARSPNAWRARRRS